MAFVREVLGDTPWQKQSDILAALAASRRVAVRSSHGVGKTWVAARAALWMLYTHPNSVVVTTAPTWKQVRDLLWREIRSAHRGAKVPLPGRCHTTELELGDRWFAVGLSTNEPVNFQGFHAEGGLLFIADEASGVAEAIYEAGKGFLTGSGSYELLIGNPNQASGTFYQAFKSERWTKFHINAMDAPESLVSREWIEDRKADWGEESPAYQVRVLGEFPEQGEDSLISLKWVVAAQGRELEAKGRVEMGVDIARYGCFDDRTEILTDDGWKFFASLTGEEQVLTLNGDVAEWGPITKLHRYEYDGTLNLYDGEKVNFCITDNHRLLAKSDHRRKAWRIQRYDQLSSRFVIRRSNQWTGHSPESITFRSVFTMPHGGERVREWTFDFGDWARFLGWFVSEGNVYRENRKHGRFVIQIAQYPGPKRELIRTLLEKMGLRYRETLNRQQFVISNNEIGRYLLQHCEKGATHKRIPPCIREAAAPIMEAFLETFRLGDGTLRSGGTRDYITSSKKLADDVQEMLVKLGRSGKLSLKSKSETIFHIGKRQVVRRNSVYVVTERQRACDSDVYKDKVRRVRYQGYVYCVSTPRETIMVRRNGCAMWSGNSSESVAYVRQGSVVLASQMWAGNDTMTSAGRIAALARAAGAKLIKVDEIGVGAGVVDRLKEEGLPVQGINVGMTATDKERFINQRSEIFWGLRERFQSGEISVPAEDTKLLAQLTALRFSYTPRGQIKLESKEDLRHRGLPSPDRADALALSFAPPPPGNPLAGLIVGIGVKGW